MSLYRQAGGRRGRTLAVVAVLTLIVGGIVGFALGRATSDEPTLAEQVENLGDEVRPAISALELVTIEYPEAVRGGEVVAQTEYEAARSQVQTAIDVFTDAEEDLRLIAPDLAAAAERRLGQVEELVGARADAAEVRHAADDAAGLVTAAAGIQAPPAG